MDEFQNKKLSEIEGSLSSTLIEPIRPDNKDKSLLSENRIEEIIKRDHKNYETNNKEKKELSIYVRCL